MEVPYENLVQIGIFIVAPVGLCYQIFKDKKYAAISYAYDDLIIS